MAQETHRCLEMEKGVFAYGHFGRTTPHVGVRIFKGKSPDHVIPVGGGQPQPDGWKLEVKSGTEYFHVLVGITACPFCGDSFTEEEVVETVTFEGREIGVVRGE